jgi:hypothetical protein
MLESTIERRGREWKVSIVDETDVTITARVRPLKTITPVEFTFPFRSEFNSFGKLATEAVDRYLNFEDQVYRALSRFLPAPDMHPH